MWNRSRKLVAITVAGLALALVAACGKDNNGGSSADTTSISSPDEVLKVVDKGFALYQPLTNSNLKAVSYGFVVENVSDKVAVTVRVGVNFTDKAGNPFPNVTGGGEFSVVLPGQRIGSGGSQTYNGEATPADMNVAVTLIASLDTPKGERHRKPPSPYAELRTGTPVQSGDQRPRRPYTVEVTNTYDVPIKPKVTAVVRDAAGAIVGGASGNVVKNEIQPGASAPATFTRDVGSPKLLQGTVEVYADPALGKVIIRNPVWQAEVR